jgi:hypothetical protein
MHHLETPEAEEANQEPGGPVGVEEEEEEKDERGRDDEHERRIGLQLHDLGVGVLLPTQGDVALLGRLQQQRQRVANMHIFTPARRDSARPDSVRFCARVVYVYVRTSSPTTTTVHTEAQATVPTAIIQRKGMAPSKDGFSGAYMRMSTAPN